jgi:hypothetical protein
MIIIPGLLSIICLVVALYFWFLVSKPAIQILTAAEIQNVISEDADHYYDKFHKKDFKVRDVDDKPGYLFKIAKSGCAPEGGNGLKVEECIATVHAHLSERRNETIHGIDMNSFLNLPWKIGFTRDNNYENGLPHTRGDVIILNNEDIAKRTHQEVCRLLIHEKSHVYQKKRDMSLYMKEKYTEVKRKDYTDESVPANPDTNDTIYRCNETNEILGGTYAETPTHFRDVVFTLDDHTMEHPFESIAYKMEKLI